MSVFTFGETMVALRGDGQLKLGGTMAVSVAGAESNVAIGLARLGHPVHWAGAVGADEAGALVLRTLRAEGVGVTGTTRDGAAPTGLLLFEPRLPGVTRVHYYRAGSAGSRIAADDVERAFSAFLEAGTGAGTATSGDPHTGTSTGTDSAARVLHLTGITPALSPTARTAAEHAMELAAEHDVLISLDVNFRSRLWSTDEASAVMRDWAPRADVLIASDDELPLCLPAGSRMIPPGRRKRCWRPGRARSWSSSVRRAPRRTPCRANCTHLPVRCRSWTRSARATRSSPGISRRCSTARTRRGGWTVR